MGARENKCQILQEYCENTGKIRKISCVIYFLGLSREIFFGVISDN